MKKLNMTINTKSAMRSTAALMLVITTWILFIGFWAFIISFAIWGASHGAR
jgi:hypothetical protein